MKTFKSLLLSFGLVVMAAGIAKADVLGGLIGGKGPFITVCTSTGTQILIGAARVYAVWNSSGAPPDYSQLMSTVVAGAASDASFLDSQDVSPGIIFSSFTVTTTGTQMDRFNGWTPNGVNGVRVLNPYLYKTGANQGEGRKTFVIWSRE